MFKNRWGGPVLTVCVHTQLSRQYLSQIMFKCQDVLKCCAQLSDTLVEKNVVDMFLVSGGNLKNKKKFKEKML